MTDKRVLVHRVRKRPGLTPEKALEYAKSRIWWNVGMVFYPNECERFYIWRAGN